MAFSWSSSLESSRPPDRSNRYIAIDDRRVFASSKDTCYLPSCRPYFSQLIHPRHLVLGWLRVDAISEVKADRWFHTLGGVLMVSPSMAFLEMALFFFFAEMYLGEGEIPLQDARKGFAMLLIFHLF